MERIMSLRWLASLLALLPILAGNAAAEPPADHTTSEHGFMHAEDKDYPAQSHCTDCHGSDILGGIGPSCYECHTDYWRYFDPAAVTPPLDHTIVRGGRQHKPGHLDPINEGCTLCHGENLNDGFAISCFTCHEPIWAGSGPPSDHTELIFGFAEHKPGYDDPFANNCTQCHGPGLDDGFATSCFTCHGPIWDGNEPPIVDAGGPYAGVAGQPVNFDASGTVDPDGDVLTYQWDFGDGSPPTSPSEDPTASHTYAELGSCTAELTVTDGVTPPVSVDVAVEISDSTPCLDADTWSVTTTASPPETFSVTFTNYAGILSVIKDDGVNPPSLAMGIEFEGVIFWMDIWIDVGANVFWGTGNTYFGNIDRTTGTMFGLVFDDQGGAFTFSATEE